MSKTLVELRAEWSVAAKAHDKACDDDCTTSRALEAAWKAVKQAQVTRAAAQKARWAAWDAYKAEWEAYRAKQKKEQQT